MNNRFKRSMIFLLPLLLTACGDSGHSGPEEIPTPSPPQSVTYTATLTGLSLTKAASDESLPVTGLPVEGATITVE